MELSKVAAGAMAFLLALSTFGAVFLISANAALEKRANDLNASLSSQLAQSQEANSALRVKYDKSQQELSSVSGSLSTAQAELAFTRRQLWDAERQVNESRASLASQQRFASEIAANLSVLEGSINSSMAWFSENAFMPKGYSWAGDIFMERISSDCVDRGNLNLACISHLMENTAFAIHYREDISSGSEDHLQSVKETIRLGWGDCEDYALIFKAILNSMRAKNGSLTAMAWQPAESGEFRVYPKESSGSNEAYYVYVNAKGAPMGGLSHAYVVCYSVTPSTGHCTVALSGVSVNESSQVPLLEGAYVFEPQSGRYLGKIGESLSICSHDGCRSMGGKIWLVIADNDLYIYGSGGWSGYADSLSLVRQEEAAISG